MAQTPVATEGSVPIGFALATSKSIKEQSWSSPVIGIFLKESLDELITQLYNSIMNSEKSKTTSRKGAKLMDRTGQKLGNYRIVCPLGRGGFADVYLGEHIYLKTPVAVKVLRTT